MEVNILGWIGLGFTVFITGANCATFMIIKFNDLHHLDLKLDKAIDKLDTMDKKLDNTSERVAKIEGKCVANHG